MALSDLEAILVEGCRRGDEEAWRTLFRTYAPDLGRYLRGMVRDRAEVDDLVQASLIEFLRSIDRFRGEASLRTWLHRIARHVALTASRGRTRREKHLAAYAARERRRAPDPHAAVEARQRLGWVHRLIDELEPDFREVWLLREVQHLEVAECATVLDIPPGTVLTRHHRARQKLIAMLESLEEEPPAPLRLVNDGEES
ncbi:MAG: RNA polymerase sigma factor [Myxococcota bacterium]